MQKIFKDNAFARKEDHYGLYLFIHNNKDFRWFTIYWNYSLVKIPCTDLTFGKCVNIKHPCVCDIWIRTRYKAVQGYEPFWIFSRISSVKHLSWTNIESRDRKSLRYGDITSFPSKEKKQFLLSKSSS